MKSRLVSFLPGLIVAMALPAMAQDNADVVDLMKEASSSQSPIVAFLTGAEQLGGVDLDRAEIERALADAGVAKDAPLAQLLSKTTTINKDGGKLKLSQSEPVVVKIGDRTLRLDENASIELSKGKFEDLSESDRTRLSDADSDAGYVRFQNIRGLDVGESESKLFQLFDLFVTAEKGKPVAHVKAGTQLMKRWSKVELDAAQKPATNGIVKRMNDVTAAQDGEQSKAEDESKDAESKDDEAKDDTPAAPATDTPEAKDEIDSKVEELEPELDMVNEELKEMMELWRKDQAEASKRMEDRIKELQEQTAHLEQKLLEMKMARNGGMTPITKTDDPRYGDRVDGPNGVGQPIGRNGETPITKEEDKTEKKESIWEKLLMKVLEGVVVGLQSRFAKAHADNLDAKVKILDANTTPVNAPYLDHALRNAVTKSSLGNTTGVNYWNAPGSIRVTPMKSNVGVQPGHLGVNRTKLNMPLGFTSVPNRGGSARPAAIAPNANMARPVAVNKLGR